MTLYPKCLVEVDMTIKRISAQSDWRPIVKVEHYRLKQDSMKRPVELRDNSPDYRSQ